ncbi:MAG: uracil-DNA glycosylase [Acidobacteriota bacterium]
MTPSNLQQLDCAIVACRLCPRLVEYREKVALQKVHRYRDLPYWGKPVPGFGDPHAQVVIIGLAPGAHGSNRTGRMFTGDRSGEWLYEALFHYGFASQPRSLDRQDGLELKDAYITAAVRCAPPDNKPSTGEKDTCRPYLVRELQSFQGARVVLALGGIAVESYWKARRDAGQSLGWRTRQKDDWKTSRPLFGHALEYFLREGPTLLCSYHPSQQNTQTGRLTRAMFHSVFARVRRLVDAS